MNEIINLFQNIAFPVAVCIVLFYVLYGIIRSEIKKNDETINIVKDANEKHLLYLQGQNERLTIIISECTKALTDNTKAFNELMNVLEVYKTKK